jgi:two-component system, OmpR family, sensor histidine kinase KdpD
MKSQSTSRWFDRQQGFRVLWQSLIAWGVIALFAYCGFTLGVNLLTISSLFLLVVVAVAFLCGFWQASLTSLMAVVCLDYLFLPPLFHFNITDSQDWVALGTFEVTALVISRLSAKEIRSASEAAFHRTGMEKLYELSRSSLLLDLRQPPGPQLAVLIHRIFGPGAVALFDKSLDREDRMGDWNIDKQDLARNWFLREVTEDDLETGTSQRILEDGSGILGALVVRGNLNPLVVDALASLSAIAIDRHQSFEKEEKADIARRGEELRAAVMDALAHEIKQPLTTVYAASSGLLEMGGLTDLQRNLVQMIDDEAIRLKELCTRLLLTAKLNSEQVGLDKDEVNLLDLISEVLASPQLAKQRERFRVKLDAPELSVSVNRGLLGMIVTQYIDNARKYSTPDTPITIAGRKSLTDVVISVHNFGSTVRIEDRERIFDRFYRASDVVDSIPGTGIGLSVVRKAAEAHHGHVWVISDEQEGTTFFVSLPSGVRRNQ